MRVGSLLAVGILASCGQRPPDVPADPRDVCEADVAPRGARRLTTTQLERALEDLTGQPGPWAVGLPPESGGWEGLADSQPVVPALVEAWDAAARRVADAVVAQGQRRWVVEAEGLAWPEGGLFSVPAEGDDAWWQVGMAGGRVEVDVPVQVPQAGRYAVDARVLWSVGWTHTREAPSVNIAIDGVWQAARTVRGEAETSEWIGWEVQLPAGASILRLAVDSTSTVFISVALDAVAVEGPLDAPFSADGPVRARWVGCDPRVEGPATCAGSVLQAFAHRAWRRPLHGDEPAALDAVVAGVLADGGDFNLALHTGVRAVLLAPSFLYRWDDLTGMASGEIRPRSSLERASRLSFALWASIPDEELLSCAERGGLGLDDEGPCGLTAQVDRMLAHPRADAVVADFGRQWLGLDALSGVDRDPVRYGVWDATLAAEAADETYALLEDARVRRLDPMALVDADWSFPPPGVAALYGVAPSGGEPVPLPPERRGLLGHASVLALTSHADRSSPVQRGKYVLDRLLCDPPEPAPPGVPALGPEAVDGDVADALAAHREQPACRSCHEDIDPLGLALEDFDAIGQHRVAYPDGTPVHPDGALPDGTEVRGLAELAVGLAAAPEVRRCLSRSLATWLWERPAGDEDASALAAADAAADLDALRRSLVIGPDALCVEAP